MNEHPSLVPVQKATEQIAKLPELNMDEVKAKIAEIRQIQEENEARLKEILVDLDDSRAKDLQLRDLMIRYLERRT